MSTWNFGDVWEAVADELPDAPALVHGPDTLTWRELDRRADSLARWLLGAGIARQDKVAIYLYNCSEYLETTFACFKLGLVPINTNYRYADDELVYLWENADTRGRRLPRCLRRTDRGDPRPAPVGQDLAVGRRRDGGLPRLGRPLRGGSRRGRRTERVRPPWGRSPDDLYMLYTGGTTGMPKGVMWRQDDLFARLNSAGSGAIPRTGASTTSGPSCAAAVRA